MLKRDCWRARFNWSAEILMTRARLSWALLCSMMIQPLHRVHWTKRHRPTSGLARTRKQIGLPGSCTRDIPITPAVRFESSAGSRLLHQPREMQRAGFANTVASTRWILLHPRMTKFRPLLAEFIGTFALIFVGIGAIKTAGNDVLAVALAHGLTIAAFVSATLHISGGQLNPAVTFS